MDKIIKTSIFVIMKLSLLGCAVGTVDTMESGDRATEQNRVLIATQNSDFKQAVIQAVRDTLENNSSYIKVIDAMSSASVMTQATTIGQLLAEKALEIVKSP